MASVRWKIRSPSEPEPRDPERREPEPREPQLRRAFLYGPERRRPEQREPQPRGPQRRRPWRQRVRRSSTLRTKVPSGAAGNCSSKGLELLTYRENPDSLAQLRKQFQEGGFRDQEREITYALKREEAEAACAICTWWEGPIVLTSANCGSFVFNKVFFDWTCQYGMSPGRPLILGLLLWFVCSLLYFGFIHTVGESGLYRVYGKSVPDVPSAPHRVERISRRRPRHPRGPWWLIQFFWRECLLLRTSMFFSLMSAFNIGFRDINFGRWLRLLTRQEFDIKAVGWARVVAGWQSLISVFLIALWVLTYFGRPFG